MCSLNNQSVYWDSVAKQKSFAHPFNTELFESEVSRDAHILDYGCGHGRLVQYLSDRGFSSVVGLDSSSEMIRLGEMEYPGADLRVISGDVIPFEDSSFDVVILFAVFTCIATNNGQRSLVSEVRRILRANGMIYMSDYPLQNDGRNRRRYELYESKYDRYGTFELSDGAVVRHHDPEWFEELFTDFESISSSEVDVTTMNGNPAKGFQYLGRAV